MCNRYVRVCHWGIVLLRLRFGDLHHGGRCGHVRGVHAVRAGPRGYVVSVLEGPRVSGHRPSVDVLFRSVAKAAGNKALGVILTGMGSDGAQGLVEMRKAGAHTLGQDEESCVVYGRPKAAFDLGAVERQVSLEQMPHRILASL